MEFPQVRLLFWASETVLLRGVWDRKGREGYRESFLRVAFSLRLDVKGIKR